MAGRTADGLGRLAAEQADQRERAGLRRALVPRPAGDRVIDLAGNDYLGLSRHPAVVAAAAAAARTWGAGAGASRLVTGTLEVHADLEAALAAYLGSRRRWSSPPATTPTSRS